MGNDGGSIPGRQDLVKEKAKEKRIQNNDLVRQSQSRYCALTKEPLNKPIVGDRLGFLYNKESLIQALLEKRVPKTYSHITSLKDLKDLIITFSDDKVDIIGGEHKIKCPITMIEFSGLNCFYIIWKCGCVISKKAVEELNMKDKCVNCGTNVDMRRDLVSLNYTTKEREEIFNAIVEEKNKLREKKNNRNKIAAGKEKNGKEIEIKFLNKKRNTEEINEEDDKIININSVHIQILDKKEENSKEKEDDFLNEKINIKKSRIEN